MYRQQKPEVVKLSKEGGIPMTTKIQKWGNSLAVRIPRHVAEQLSLQQGSEVEMTVDKHEITLKPKSTKPTLEELLSQCTPDKRHEEIDFGRIGRELI